MNAHERDFLIQLQDQLKAKGQDITAEGKKMLMEADEADFDRLVEFIGDDE